MHLKTIKASSSLKIVGQRSFQESEFNSKILPDLIFTNGVNSDREFNLGAVQVKAGQYKIHLQLWKQGKCYVQKLYIWYSVRS